MNPKSANALSWTSAIFIILALSISSPSGTFALLVLAGICSVIPALFAAKRPRLFSAFLLLAAVALAVNSYPAFEQDQAAYTKQVKERADKGQAVSGDKK